jgi:hypothetical protein
MGNPSFSGLVRDRDGKASVAEGRYMLLRGDIRFGPTGFERCAQPPRGFEPDEAAAALECDSTSTEGFNELVAVMDPKNRDRYTSGAFSHAGWMAFGACLLAAAALLVSAGLAFARKQMELAISPASVALLALVTALAAGCVFIATKPGPPGMLGVDLGFWAFGAGAVLGILGAQLLAKELRPPDPDLLDGALHPDDFSAFPTGRGAATAAATPAPTPVLAPMVPVPPTQPVEVLDLELGASSPGDAKKPGDES